MDANVRAAIARIVCGEQRGTGFLIQTVKVPALVLTARHVVVEALSGAPVELQFQGTKTSATILKSDELHDWALLSCADVPPVKPLALSVAQSSGVSLTIFGFPDGQPVDGLVMKGEVRNHLAELRRVPMLQVYCDEAAAGTGFPVRGLSGGPCIAANGSVLGVLRSSLLSGGSNVGGTLYACSSATIASANPELLGWINECDGLPPVSGSMPREPFRGLGPYTADDAVLFSGRCREIRLLLQRIDDLSGGVIVVSGESGVGKSSLLHAGLLPRLRGHTRYVRRGLDGLTATLQRMLGGTIAERWGELEADGLPLTVVLDQIEEVWTQQRDGDELGELLSTVAPLVVSGRIKGRLVLSIRKEWFTNLTQRLNAWERLRWEEVHVNRLDRDALLEVINSGLPTAQRGDPFRLRMEDGLALRIAEDLTEDRASPVAPLAQVLLSRLWADALERPQKDGERLFTRETYERFKKEGLHLSDFVDRQLAALERDSSLGYAVVDGLALDVLEAHTTALSSASSLSASDYDRRYAHALDRRALAQRLIALNLLASTADGGTRLAHDTLAPHVKARFARSRAVGQRARRVLEARAADMHGSLLDGVDLRRVKSGLASMRALTPEESSWVAVSTRALRRRSLLLAGGLVFVALVVASLTGRWLDAQQKIDLDADRRLVAAAAEVSRTNPTMAALLMREVANPEKIETFTARLSTYLTHPLASDIVREGEFPSWYRPDFERARRPQPLASSALAPTPPWLAQMCGKGLASARFAVWQRASVAVCKPEDTWLLFVDRSEAGPEQVDSFDEFPVLKQSPNGRWVAVVGSRGRMIDLSTAEMRSLEMGFIQFGADSLYLVSLPWLLEVRKLPSGDVIFSRSGSDELVFGRSELTPDGGLLWEQGQKPIQSASPFQQLMRWSNGTTTTLCSGNVRLFGSMNDGKTVIARCSFDDSEATWKIDASDSSRHTAFDLDVIDVLPLGTNALLVSPPGLVLWRPPRDKVALSGCFGFRAGSLDEVTVSPSGDALWMYCPAASGGEPYALVWNLETEPELRFAAVDLTAASVVAAKTDGTVFRWDSSGESRLDASTLPPVALHAGKTGVLAVYLLRARGSEGDSIELRRWMERDARFAPIPITEEGTSNRYIDGNSVSISSKGTWVAYCSLVDGDENGLVLNLIRVGTPAVERRRLSSSTCQHLRFDELERWIAVDDDVWALPLASTGRRGPFAARGETSVFANETVVEFRRLDQVETIDAGIEVSRLALSADGSAFVASGRTSLMTSVRGVSRQFDLPGSPIDLAVTNDGVPISVISDSMHSRVRSGDVEGPITGRLLGPVSERAAWFFDFDNSNLHRWSWFEQRTETFFAELPFLENAEALGDGWVRVRVHADVYLLSLGPQGRAFLESRLAHATRGCLPPSVRVRALAESPAEAETSWQRCRAQGTESPSGSRN